MEQVVSIGGRKGYLQTQNVEVFWEDSEKFEKIPLKDLPAETFEG